MKKIYKILIITAIVSLCFSLVVISSSAEQVDITDPSSYVYSGTKEFWGYDNISWGDFYGNTLIAFYVTGSPFDTDRFYVSFGEYGSFMKILNPSTDPLNPSYLYIPAQVRVYIQYNSDDIDLFIHFTTFSYTIDPTVSSSGSYQEGYDAGYEEAMVWVDYAYSNGYYDGTSDSANLAEIARSEGYSDGYSDAVQDEYGEVYDTIFGYGYDSGYSAGDSAGYARASGETLEELSETISDQMSSLEDTISENISQYADYLSRHQTDGTLTQGFLAGMWDGMTDFVTQILNGVTFSGLSLMNILATAIGILVAVFIIKMIGG